MRGIERLAAVNRSTPPMAEALHAPAPSESAAAAPSALGL